MKKYFLPLAPILFFAVFSQAQPFILSGTISDQPARGKITFDYRDKAGNYIQDSTEVKDGHFRFAMDIVEPSMAYLSGWVESRSSDDPNSVSFFIDPASMTISLKYKDFKHAVIAGSKSQNENAVLAKMEEPLEDEYHVLIEESKKDKKAADKALKAGDHAAADSLKRRIAGIQERLSHFRDRGAALCYAFFADHPRSVVTAFRLGIYAYDMSLDSLQNYYDGLGQAVQQGLYGKNIADLIAQIKAGSPGSMTKNFTAMELRGNKASLSDFKGKYVMLDFWASWCVPCRASMPHMKDLYAKYKDKGFNILAISIDDDTAAWKRAIEKDGTGVWANVLRAVDMKKIRMGNDDAKDIRPQFGVQGIPARLLLDKNGMIVGRYVKDTDEDNQDMDNKLKEIFAN
jgi:thiol-disulfide isomerase/thioredoxin